MKLSSQKHLNFKSSIKTVLVFIWILFTLALCGWWVLFSLRQLKLLSGLSGVEIDSIVSSQKMVIWEGASFLALIAIGGGFLLFYVLKEKRSLEREKNYLAAFHHDLKTSIAGLQLQVQSLDQNLVGQGFSGLTSKVLREVKSLTQKINNSLFLTSKNRAQYVEEFEMADAIKSLSLLWPETYLKLEKNVSVQADRQLFQLVLNNLVQNARLHGKSESVSIVVQSKNHKTLELVFVDEGPGLKIENEKTWSLGPFSRGEHNGSGLGLYLSKMILQQMGGDLVLESYEGKYYPKIKLASGSKDESQVYKQVS